MTETRETETKDGNGIGNKYMTFRLASEEYGLEILKVRELIGLMEITRIPRAPEHVRGVINLRGKVIPVADLRLKFGMSAADPTNQTVIIVVQLSQQNGSLTMGILVDEVLEVRSIAASEVEAPPAVHGHGGSSFIMGVGKTEKRVIFLLDIDRIFGGSDGMPADVAA
jgi:purine-binding chemotaxis protein CheW